MPNVFVEPLPKGREGPIHGYALELSATQRLTSIEYGTQLEAINAARVKGYNPLVARVRVTSKGNPDHWRTAG